MSGKRGGSGLCRAVSFTLLPGSRHEDGLNRLLGSQCRLYNAALEERIGAWKWNHRSVSWVDQFKDLSGPEAREAIPSLVEFGLQPHRGTLKRLDEAFQGFFRRVKAGDTPGFPRFKSVSRFDSVTYPEATGWKMYTTGEKGTYGRLHLQGVGHIKVRLKHGPRSARVRGGVPAKLVIRRHGHSRNMRWEATVFYKRVEPLPVKPAPVDVCGVDRGVNVLATVADTNGNTELVDNPRHLKQATKKLVAAQQAVARCQRGSNRRARAVARVAVLHRRVADARRDTAHQLSRQLVNTYGTIGLDQLHVLNMVRSAKGTVEQPGSNVAAKSGLNKSILDAGWGQIAGTVVYKAEEAGRRVVSVNPRHTSQRCHTCGHVDPGNRPDPDRTVFVCVACGHQAHADVNAARNILELSTQSRPGQGHPRLTA